MSESKILPAPSTFHVKKNIYQDRETREKVFGFEISCEVDGQRLTKEVLQDEEPILYLFLDGLLRQQKQQQEVTP